MKLKTAFFQTSIFKFYYFFYFKEYTFGIIYMLYDNQIFCFTKNVQLRNLSNGPYFFGEVFDGREI